MYAVVSAVVFNKVFFPAGKPAVASIGSVARFGIAYVARPIGGLALGPWSRERATDRVDDRPAAWHRDNPLLGPARGPHRAAAGLRRWPGHRRHSAVPVFP